MTLPNLLTVSRLFLAALMMALLAAPVPFGKSAALLVFVLAGITDYLDGHLARKHHAITSFGRLMDPLTDKVLVCAAFVSFVEMQLVPAWIVVIIISREFLVTGLSLLAASRGGNIPVGKCGKHKTVWQIVAIVALLLGAAVRNDLLRAAPGDLLAGYDLAFKYIALAISAAVAMITIASGSMYYYQNRGLIVSRG